MDVKRGLYIAGTTWPWVFEYRVLKNNIFGPKRDEVVELEEIA
jgi:hypothetical protein